jgi:hypothetical protein
MEISTVQSSSQLEPPLLINPAVVCQYVQTKQMKKEILEK